LGRRRGLTKQPYGSSHSGGQLATRETLPHWLYCSAEPARGPRTM
jgi:hypothetical protein